MQIMLTFFIHHALTCISFRQVNGLVKQKTANNIAFQQQRPVTAHFSPGPPEYEVSGGWSHLYAFEIFSS